MHEYLYMVATSWQIAILVIAFGKVNVCKVHCNAEIMFFLCLMALGCCLTDVHLFSRFIHILYCPAIRTHHKKVSQSYSCRNVRFQEQSHC